MNMKKILFLAILPCIATSSYAQFGIGVKGGANANLYSLNFDDIVEQFDVSQDGKNAGFHVGAQLRFNTKIGLYFQGDVLYTYSEEKINMSSYDSNAWVAATRHGLDIPVLVGFKLGFFRVYAGPKFQASLGDDITQSISNLAKIDFKMDDEVFGYQIGIGFDIFKKLTIDLNYNGRFSQSSQELIINDSVIHGSKTTSQLWLSVGILF